jgi:hypothetical protein
MKFLNSLIQNQKLINLSYFIYIFTPVHLFFSIYFLKILFLNHNRYSNAYKYLLEDFDNTPYYDIAIKNNNSLNYYSPLYFRIFDQIIIQKKDNYYNNSFLLVYRNEHGTDLGDILL